MFLIIITSVCTLGIAYYFRYDIYNAFNPIRLYHYFTITPKRRAMKKNKKKLMRKLKRSNRKATQITSTKKPEKLVITYNHENENLLTKNKKENKKENKKDNNILLSENDEEYKKTVSKLETVICESVELEPELETTPELKPSVDSEYKMSIGKVSEIDNLLVSKEWEYIEN